MILIVPAKWAIAVSDVINRFTFFKIATVSSKALLPISISFDKSNKSFEKLFNSICSDPNPFCKLINLKVLILRISWKNESGMDLVWSDPKFWSPCQFRATIGFL